MVILLHLDPDFPWDRGELFARLRILGDVHEGDHSVHVVVGRRELALGDRFKVAADAECVAELEEFGRVEVVEALP